MRNDGTVRLSKVERLKAVVLFLVDVTLYTAALVSCIVIIGSLVESAWSSETYDQPKFVALMLFLATVVAGCLNWWFGLWRLRLSGYLVRRTD